MAKKQKTQVEPTPQVVEQPKVETPVMEKPLPKKKKDTWEVKDRQYYLNGNLSPLSCSIKSSNIYWFDKEKGYEREIKCTSNQRTPFVDEMVGDQRLDHIIFRNGVLEVPREKQTLQKLLSLYHPLKDQVFKEVNLVKIAIDEISDISDLQDTAKEMVGDCSKDELKKVLQLLIKIERK